MKGEHHERCLKEDPKCLCNRCKHDGKSLIPCCEPVSSICPIKRCPGFEPDDEEEGDE